MKRRAAICNKRAMAHAGKNVTMRNAQGRCTLTLQQSIVPELAENNFSTNPPAGRRRGADEVLWKQTLFVHLPLLASLPLGRTDDGSMTDACLLCICDTTTVVPEYIGPFRRPSLIFFLPLLHPLHFTLHQVSLL